MTDPAPTTDARPSDDLPLAGVIVLDKPYRKSSTSMVSLVKGRLRAAGAPKRVKVGHAGTLDPLATGVLVILVGRATKLSGQVMQGVKHYRALVDLSQNSTTDDLEGELTPVPVAEPPTAEHVRAILDDRFTGVVQQTPPVHSAIKVNGQRSYRLARADTASALEARPVRIDSIDIVRYDFPELELDVVCGKGTYIRSLARDIGVALHTGGMLGALRRTRVGAFSIENSITPEGLPERMTQADLTVTPEVEALRAPKA
ncbi:MAG: tRNA pseudouridine synthase B [Phycisphaeraceae bacterium]|nr:MAG: tRNA pseudouridine synthase B [Phycisphaeraceae bacterium]